MTAWPPAAPAFGTASRSCAKVAPRSATSFSSVATRSGGTAPAAPVSIAASCFSREAMRSPSEVPMPSTAWRRSGRSCSLASRSLQGLEPSRQLLGDRLLDLADALSELVELTANFGELGGLLRHQVGQQRDGSSADDAAADARQPAAIRPGRRRRASRRGIWRLGSPERGAAGRPLAGAGRRGCVIQRVPGTLGACACRRGEPLLCGRRRQPCGLDRSAGCLGAALRRLGSGRCPFTRSVGWGRGTWPPRLVARHERLSPMRADDGPVAE